MEVGSYLSGGMDSGAISAIASQHLNNLKTFTCGFDLSGVHSTEIGFDERSVAASVSQFVGQNIMNTVKSGDIHRNLRVFSFGRATSCQSYPNFVLQDWLQNSLKYVCRELVANYSQVILGDTGILKQKPLINLRIDISLRGRD